MSVDPSKFEHAAQILGEQLPDEATASVPPWTREDLLGVVNLSVQLLSQCISAGITVTSQTEVRTVVTSDAVARRGDDLQTKFGEGPCVSAAEDSRIVRVTDLPHDERWPRWRPVAADELGIRSMLCLPLFDGDDKAGALTLYADRVDAFDNRDIATARALAASSALAVAASQKITQLETALDTRSMIGQALGLVMATFRVDQRAAFKMLSRLSSDTNIRLAEVAQRLLQQHEAGEYSQGPKRLPRSGFRD